MFLRHTDKAGTLADTEGGARGKDARDFQKRLLPRFPASCALLYASHPTSLVANAFALRVSSLPTLFLLERQGRKKERKKEIVAKALDGQRYPLPLCKYM